MKYDILNRFTGDLLFAAEIDCDDSAPRSVKAGLAVKWAIKARAYLAGAYLARAYLAGAYLARADLAGAYLARADLAGAYLARANLARANLAHAKLVRADLAHANLVDANLAHAKLVRADLARADLAHANLVDANLAHANLARADLVDANLVGARNIADRIIDGGLRSDGYRFLLTRTEPGEWRVKAGCRDYTLTDARAHWGSPDYRDRGLGHEALLVIDHMQRIAEYRAWPAAEEAAA